MAVCVALVSGEPRVVLSTTLKTCTDNDRLSYEPYAIAAEISHGPKAAAAAEVAAVVAEGRKRQEQLATSNLRAMLRQLEAAGCKSMMAALLVNRAGWITDPLSYSLAWAEHVPIAEALAVRDALRHASSQCGVGLDEVDEKSLPDIAAETLDLSREEVAARLKALGATVGKPWRKEQKLACLSAWVTLSK